MDYNTVIMDLPCHIKGFVIEDGEMFHTIVLNAKLSRITQVNTMMHELEHISNEDFQSLLSADQIESLRHT